MYDTPRSQSDVCISRGGSCPIDEAHSTHGTAHPRQKSLIAWSKGPTSLVSTAPRMMSCAESGPSPVVEEADPPTPPPACWLASVVVGWLVRRRRSRPTTPSFLSLSPPLSPSDHATPSYPLHSTPPHPPFASTSASASSRPLSAGASYSTCGRARVRACLCISHHVDVMSCRVSRDDFIIEINHRFERKHTPRPHTDGPWMRSAAASRGGPRPARPSPPP